MYSIEWKKFQYLRLSDLLHGRVRFEVHIRLCPDQQGTFFPLREQVTVVGPLSGGYWTPTDPPVAGGVLGGGCGGPEPQTYPPVPGIVTVSGVFGGSAALLEKVEAESRAITIQAIERMSILLDPITAIEPGSENHRLGAEFSRSCSACCSDNPQSVCTRPIDFGPSK